MLHTKPWRSHVRLPEVGYTRMPHIPEQLSMCASQLRLTCQVPPGWGIGSALILVDAVPVVYIVWDELAAQFHFARVLVTLTVPACY